MIAVAIVIPRVAITMAFEPAAFMGLALVLRRLIERLHVRLGGLETLVEDILALLFGHLITGALAALRPRMSVHAVTVWRELLAIGHDDAVVMFRVLQIILGKHVIAGGLGIPRQRHVFLGDVRRRATNFYVGPVRFKASRKRILVLAVAIVIIVVVVVTTATTAILLSLPHCL